MKEERVNYFFASLSVFHLLCVGKSLAESQSDQLDWTMPRLFSSLLGQDLFARALDGLSETWGILPVKNGHNVLQPAEDPVELSFPPN